MNTINITKNRHAKHSTFAKMLVLIIACTISTSAMGLDKMCRDGQLFFLLNDRAKTAEVISPKCFEAPNDEYFTRNKPKIEAEYKQMTEVCIPAQVTFENITYQVIGIGFKAFEDCSTLTQVTIAEGVGYIGDYAFESCRSLQSILIPGSVTYIGEAAFYDCDGLVDLTIPEGVKSIYVKAFGSCDNLASVTLPASLNMLDNDGFCHCYKLTKVTCNAERIPCLGDCFFSDPDEHKVFTKSEYSVQDTLYVPQKSIKKYKKLPEWRLFKVILPIEGQH